MAKDPDLKDVQPGSDADATPVNGVGDTPANANSKSPSAPDTKDGEQQDDNIDDKGNKPDGSKLDQPT